MDSRKTYPRLQQIIAEATQGRGPYAELLKELRKDHPELWRQEPRKSQGPSGVSEVAT